MAEDLQNLLERINREGVEKADAQAQRIIAEAEAKAKAIVETAKAEAEAARRDAEKSAADYTERARVTLAQAARDTVDSITKSVTRLLEQLLAKDTAAALKNPDTVAKLIDAAAKDIPGGEIALSGQLATALRAELAALGKFTVVTDEALASGFTVRLDGGRIEHDFTGETVAKFLARRLRSDLAELLK